MDDPLAWVARSVGDDGARGLLPHLEPRALADGEYLLREGERSSFLYLVVEGKFRVVYGSEGHEVEVSTRGQGSWLGEIGLIDAGPATATVVANGPARVLRIGHDTLVRLTTDHPDVAATLLRYVTRQIAERIAESSSGIIEQVGPGRVRVHKPPEVRGWISRILGRLLGGDA